jgi:hypothetical protein
LTLIRRRATPAGDKTPVGGERESATDGRTGGGGGGVFPSGGPGGVHFIYVAPAGPPGRKIPPPPPPVRHVSAENDAQGQRAESRSRNNSRCTTSRIFGGKIRLRADTPSVCFANVSCIQHFRLMRQIRVHFCTGDPHVELLQCDYLETRRSISASWSLIYASGCSDLVIKNTL